MAGTGFNRNDNILCVWGDDLFKDLKPFTDTSGTTWTDEGDYRPKLREYLYGLEEASGCPVRKGTHDFWVIYHTGLNRRKQPNWSHEDMDISPRKMRGI